MPEELLQSTQVYSCHDATACERVPEIMSEAEAKQQLKAKQMTVSEQNGDVFTLQPLFEVKLPDLIIALPFRTQLTISKAGLQGVDLHLATAEAMKTAQSIYALVDVANSSMKNALTAKYGSPIEVTGSCGVSGNDLVEAMLENKQVECKTSWRSDGQLILVWWTYKKRDQSFDYFLTYQAASGDL